MLRGRKSKAGEGIKSKAAGKKKSDLIKTERKWASPKQPVFLNFSYE